MKATWYVTAFYEDAETRESAMAFCDILVKRFWSHFEFDVSWWSFASLQDPGSAGEAARKAAGADFVIFSMRAASEAPLGVQEWVEAWLHQRGSREGALVGLAGSANPCVEKAQLYLRQVAHRAGMDYLTEVPQDMPRLIAESPDLFTQRAQQVTTVLNEILHPPPPPLLQ
jgi:hypothetical protein